MTEGKKSREVRKSASPEDDEKLEVGMLPTAVGNTQQSELKNKSDPDGYRDEIPQSEIQNPQSEITMEVHHHPQLEHKSKPWKEYLLEGLMIFLAVTMGFFAESLREHIADKNKEQQYIQSLAEDLRGDIKTFELQIKEEKGSLRMLDSLIAILDKPTVIPRHGDDLYYFGRMGPRQKNLTVNMRTFEQLKNSGNFRLVSNIGLSNRIMSYYEKVTYIRQIEDLFTQEFTGYKQLAAKVFDPAVFKRLEDGNGGVVKSNNNPALQKDALQFTTQLAVYAVYMNGSRGTIIAADEKILQNAKDLLNYLQQQ